MHHEVSAQPRCPPCSACTAALFCATPGTEVGRSARADGKKEIITASLDKTMALWRLEVRRSMLGGCQAVGVRGPAGALAVLLICKAPGHRGASRD